MFDPYTIDIAVDEFDLSVLSVALSDYIETHKRSLSAMDAVEAHRTSKGIEFRRGPVYSEDSRYFHQCRIDAAERLRSSLPVKAVEVQP